MELGKLEKVELRNAWRNEAADFTKWLAKEENLLLLSDEIGVNIKLVETESAVGGFSSDIFAEDKLFATLDPTSRRLRFPEDVEVIITDTVGFIRNLPDELMQAFKATLEELYEADLLIHVIDISNPRFVDQMHVVENILKDLGLHNIPCLRVFNKIDRVDNGFVGSQLNHYKGVALSALDSETFEPFMREAQRLVEKKWYEAI